MWLRLPYRNAILALTLAPLPAGAAGPGEGAAPVGALLLSLAALLAAVPIHWGLRRLAFRLPRVLARRTGKPITPGVPLPWEGIIQLGILALKVGLWLAVALYASNQFAGLQRAREMLERVVVMSVTSPMFVLNSHGYSALDLLELPAVLALVWIAIGALTRVLKVHILRATRMERGVQEAVALLVRYTLVFLGAIVILQIWGIDASSLTFVASVLGVGIGFGLQHIANNFVSGLVVSLERPIQPGDFVKVGEWSGTVERVGPRNTEIRTLDNVSILVPNSRFLETEVVNWSHGDPVSRLHVPVGVAYGSDIGQVRAALFEAARSHPDVLGDPRPRVEFRGFGDSALHFELLVWTRDPRIQYRLISDLNYRIESSLRRHKVHIPFPQQDLHLRSPQLEKLLNAWSRRTFTEAELSGTNGQDGMSSPAEEPGVPQGFEDELSPRSWSDEQLDALVTRMRGADGLTVADRRHLFTVYPACFVGREAVDWMTRALGLSRQEAVEVGQLLVDRGVVHHVLDEHGFIDANLFYRFRTDQTQPRQTTALRG
jgi:potassium efflux system protein